MARDILAEETDNGQLDQPQPQQFAIPPRRSLEEIKADAASRLQSVGLQQPNAPGTEGNPALDDLLKKAATYGQAPPKEGVLSGTGKQIMGGLAGIGSQIAGAGEYLSRRTFGADYPVTQGLHSIRNLGQEAQNYWSAELTPQEQELGERQWATLDPHKTIFQGGPKEAMHAIALQVAGAAPAALTTLLGAGAAAKIGINALTYIGATQTGLSMGQLSNNIQDEIQNTPEDTLRQRSPKYAQLIASGMDPIQARQQVTDEALKYAPVIGGLVSGAVATVAGRFLTPVLSKEGASLGARVGGAAADQAIQGGATAGTDYIARETAAHTYDSGRAPDLVEAARQTAEGAVTGGLTGAGFGAVMGHGPTHEPSNNPVNPAEAHETMANTPEGKATGAATETHVNTISEQQELPLSGGYSPPRQQDLDLQGGGRQPMPIEFNGQGQLDLRVEPQQGQLPLGSGQADMFSGVHADEAAAMQSHSGYQGAPPPETTGPNQPPGWGMQEPNGPQGNLDLRGGQMNPPRPGPEAGLANVPSQLNLPFEQRLPGVGRQRTQPMVEPPRTRADDLREKAAAARTPDENQPDLFRDQPVPGQLTTRSNRPMVRGNADNPSAEPFGDIQAQLKDLQDPNHPRQGVYLSADNIERLRRDGLLDQVRQAAGEDAVPMVHFDQKGGTLIAKNQAAADELAHYRDKKVGSMEEILGHATGAGAGKPLNGEFVVQQHDDQGNVTRETGVATREEAEQLAHEYTDVARGRTAQVLSAPAAILRRAQLIGLEGEHIQRAKAEKGASRAVSDAVDRNIGSGVEVQSRALEAARRDLATGEESPPISREEAALRLTGEARKLHNEARTRTWPGTGVLDPSDLAFHSPDATREYQKLHDEFLGSQVMRRSTVHPQDAEKGRIGQEIAERRIAAFLKENPHETKAEQVARAAVEVSREGVKGYLADKRVPGRRLVEPHPSFDPGVLEPARRPSRAEIHGMNETEFQRVYNDVLERSQNGARTKMTIDQMRAEDDDVRSKMEKRVNRFFRSQEKTEEMGHAKSEKFSVSPRRALTEREQQLNAAKSGTKSKRLVGYKTFDPEALLSTVESQREMERAARMSPEERRAERVAQYKDLADHITAGEKHVAEVAALKRSELKSEGSPQLAAKYGREILQFGRALKGQSLHSPEARSAAKKFNTLIEALGKKSPAARAQYLLDTYEAEIQRQARSSARANPLAVGRVKDMLEDGLSMKKPPKMGPFEPIERQDVGRIEHRDLRSTGNQMSLPFEERVQPVGGYTGLPERFTPAHEEELAALLNAKKQPFRGDSGKFEKRPREGAIALRDMRAAADTRAQLNEAEEAARYADRPAEMKGTDEDGTSTFSAYQLRHEAAIAQRRREEGIEPEPYIEPFQGRQAEHEGAIAKRMREEDAELRSTMGVPQGSRGIKDAAAKVAELMEGNPIRGSTAIQTMLAHLPEGSPFHDLFTQLQSKIDPKTVIGFAGKEAFTSPTVQGKAEMLAGGPRVTLNRDHFEQMRQLGFSPELTFTHTIAHELVHVATAHAIYRNPALAAELSGILRMAREAGGGHYGLTDINEMVAEAYSNRTFQDFLKGVKIPDTNVTLWDRVKNFVARILGREPTTRNMTALEAIMRNHDHLFTGKQYATTPGEIARMRAMNLESDPERGHVGNALDRLGKSLGLNKEITQRLRDTATDATQGLGQVGLSAMTPRQQSDHFSKYFQKADGSNPYKRYWDTFFKRSADNAASMERVGKLSNSWSNLEEKYGIDTAHGVSKLMHDATLYQFHPELALDHEANAHLTSPEQQARWREGAAAFSKLPEDWQAHYKMVKNYYANEQRHTTDQIVLNGLHSMLTKGEDAPMTAKEFDAKYDVDAVRSLKLDTQDGLTREFGDKLSGASMDTLAKIGSITQRNGPYFPLMRNGDYIVTAERKLGSKEFDSSKEANAYMQEKRASDPTLSVSVKQTDDGTFRVTTSEKEVRMAESKSEANQHRQEMVARYGDENVKPVQLKADLYKQETSITSGSALDTILRKLDDNPAAQNAIKEFYLRSLGDQSFRKRELQRSGRRGVDVENQHRSFAQYGRSQSYYLSQLKYGRHLANAQGDVNTAVRGHTTEDEKTKGVSAVRMGEFARELALRDEISRNPYKVGELVRKGTSLTGFMMLTSPSHWFVRAAQPYVLSAPWLGARHGFSDSVAALGRAQRMIADPLMKETANSALGLKALFSRASAEKSYSVIDDVLSHINRTAGADAPKIQAMVQHLRENNLIDLSMATELSDIGKGKSTGLTSRVLDASRIMLHLCEVNNRVMTAIAARELGLKAGMTEQQAVEHAADAINVTHNDYSYGNTPRLFMAQSKGLLGGARPLLFQFMKYPQQVYGMMISSGLAALKGKTRLEREVGVKTLLGVLATHMIAAGAVGATIQPIKWAMGALMAGASAIGATDQQYTIANALSGDTYDEWMREVTNDLFGTEMGELVSKGLPTAVGVDLSQRMALGSLYQFHLKTDSDASTIGSLAQTFGGPWLNVATNFYDSGKKFLGGDVLGGIQGMSPHIIRDLVKAGQMSQQGVVNNAGTTLIPADKLSAGQVFAQSMGFRPDEIAEVQNRNNAERNELQNMTDQRKGLIRSFVAAEPNARQDIRTQVMEFNKQHPGFSIDSSTLLRAVAAKAQTDREMQMYGVRAKARQLPELTRAGGAYNTD